MNKLIVKLKSEFVTVRIPDVGEIIEALLFVYCDFANLGESCAAQDGFIILLVGENGTIDMDIPETETCGEES